MATSNPPAKRKRVDSLEDASIIRSDIWYLDGSVVLQAHNTQFRVHWSFLTEHSSFFRDMQGLPQPPDDQPTVDGCPVIELSDALVDVEHLLRALYKPTFLLQKTLPFPVVAALVRLGLKYAFEDLLANAVERLTYENPATVQEYDACCATGSKRIEFYPGIFFDVITLARENNLPRLLPAAFNRAISDYPLASVFDGFPRPDGTRALLSSCDQKAVVLARDKFIQAQQKVDGTLGWLFQWQCRVGVCLNPALCIALRNRIYNDLLNNPRLVGLGEPNLVQRWLTSTASAGGPHLVICGPCRQFCHQAHVVGRNRMWDALPSFFDLPPWGELKNDL
ncbi:hypothetical protein C8R46DRAFT_1055562 [Mycena filopes]|nr:hypothetical protein C8R46DRAFT_1055562 [Mycena filopes]